MALTNPSRSTVEDVVEDWPASRPGQPQHPRETAEKMLEKYGTPDEVTANRLVWHDNGPWKRTEVHRDGPEHRFPVPHVDHLYQFVDYQVPPGKHDDLARFDGSLLLRRTEGEMGVTCHEERANVLALNLAHDVVTGEKSVDEAREAYGKLAAETMAGRPPAYAREFQFPLPETDQGDPDVTIVAEEVEQHSRGLALAGVALAGLLYLLMRRRRTRRGTPDVDRPRDPQTTRGPTSGAGME